MRSPLLVVLLLSSITILGITHFVALEFYLYWKYLWLDLPMHALGGIVVALGIFALPLLSFIRLPERYLSPSFVLTGVLIVGLIWELFEIAIGIPLIEEGFEIDILADLTMDILGGAIGYIVGSRIRML